MIREHNKATIEAQWSHKQALDWAMHQAMNEGRWTSRRYRVEGGSGGNSRLTTKSAAERLVSRVGGRVVEVIPPSKKGWKLVREQERIGPFLRRRDFWHSAASALKQKKDEIKKERDHLAMECANLRKALRSLGAKGAIVDKSDSAEAEGGTAL